MVEYEFCLHLAPMSEDAFDRLSESLGELLGQPDCTPAMIAGEVRILFGREAESMEEAIRSAIADVQKAGGRVARVSSETIDEINAELQTSNP